MDCPAGPRESPVDRQRLSAALRAPPLSRVADNPLRSEGALGAADVPL
jgi:hypothetical protein